MSFLNNPNWARDMLWSSTLRSIRDATNFEDLDNMVLMLGTDHIVVRIMPDVMLVLELPAEASTWTEDDYQQYLNALLVTINLT